MATRPLVIMRFQARLVPLTSLWVVPPAVISLRVTATSILATMALPAIPTPSDPARVASIPAPLSPAFLDKPPPVVQRFSSLQTESLAQTLLHGGIKTILERWQQQAKRSYSSSP